MNSLFNRYNPIHRYSLVLRRSCGSVVSVTKSGCYCFQSFVWNSSKYCRKMLQVSYENLSNEKNRHVESSNVELSRKRNRWLPPSTKQRTYRDVLVYEKNTRRIFKRRTFRQRIASRNTKYNRTRQTLCIVWTAEVIR